MRVTAPKQSLVVYGAGSIGCYIGGRLEVHTPVRYIGRDAMLTTLREHGLSTSDYRGHASKQQGDALDLQTETPAASEAALVLVCVKSAATADAATQLAAVLKPGSLVISLQNGLHNAQILQAALPQCTVLAGMVPFNVVQRAPGVFHQASSGELMVQADAALARWLPVFAAAGLPLQPRDDMPAVQRAKLLLNLNNAINALAGLPLREQLSQRNGRRCLALAQREALEIFQAAGLPVARLTLLPPAWLPRVLALPDVLFSLIAARMLAIDPLARSSMWDDLKAGRRTEVDYINGEVVTLADAHGCPAPINARLCALVHAAEQSPRAWPQEALLAVLRSSSSAQ
jgi:2-dehydropantoate 2-reductase